MEVETYDGSGEPFLETEEEQAFLDLMTQFLFANRNRYKKQAKKLFNEGLLLVQLDNSVLKYWLEEEGASYSVSHDKGLTFSNSLGLVPLHCRRRTRTLRLIEQFAHSEARIISGL